MSGAVLRSDEYFAGTGVVSVGLSGDFNDDGSVDSGDYVLWRQTPSSFGGDAGYNLWRANYGLTSAPASGAAQSLSHGAVPEPDTIILALLGCATLYATRIRCRFA